MKSKVHNKNSTINGSFSSCTQHNTSLSSESDTEDSGMDSSDESTRQQEHEAAYGLLSLSQKPTQTNSDTPSDASHLRNSNSVSSNEIFMSSEEIAYVTKTSYARNKILDQSSSKFAARNVKNKETVLFSEESEQTKHIRNYLGKCSASRPLTYPYTSTMTKANDILSLPTTSETMKFDEKNKEEKNLDSNFVKQFHVIQKYSTFPAQQKSPKIPEEDGYKKNQNGQSINIIHNSSEKLSSYNDTNFGPSRVLPTVKINDVTIPHEHIGDLRKRKFSVTESDYKNKVQRNDEVMDLSITTIVKKHYKNGVIEEYNSCDNVPQSELPTSMSPERLIEEEEYRLNNSESTYYKKNDFSDKRTVVILTPLQSEDQISLSYIKEQYDNSSNQSKSGDYDNSAMETLADIATQREKLDKNMLAQNVASEFLKLATKNEKIDGSKDPNTYSLMNKDVNDIIVKAEGNKSCTICSKNFNKPSQLRLHMNIHYLERPFRCESCSVSFRTKGHLQKHERSASHHNKTVMKDFTCEYSN
ncbi:hypothetical protein NQ315_007991 [Exocentrus adspersus]|uniref:C2H2-type domain-containing protein n=1 Tax=Exocentrus adspersus TaxID=1586481 RepID=A0AAV8VFE1_9CUCU|nr:hypothetical protein NQ315_007991 [Exocentrus adspersus]